MEAESKKEPYKIVIEGGTGEIEEKKSRFIANVSPVETEEAAAAFIEKMKKKYWDARHNCYAYILGEKAQLARFSDDGEPSGTAGKPILEVLSGIGLRSAVIVVTRYFGGTLLGTGGLVRAYTQAAQAGVAASRIGVMIYGNCYKITTDYNGIGKIQYIMGLRKIMIEDAQYAQDVSFQIKVPYEESEALIKEVTEATAGKARIEKAESLYYIAEGRTL
ncbi:MAG: YigZ family protein [Bacillus sp. (in: Bacteria)]|nr:YigZ family protein [Bacillus sp. (in: firmicutes)]MCM1427386.1 YigZ family protein [Eubacterium sp.]